MTQFDLPEEPITTIHEVSMSDLYKQSGAICSGIGMAPI